MKTPRKIRSVSAEMIRKMFISSMTTSMLIELSQVGSGLIDGLVTAHYLGGDAIAAVGIAAPFFSICGVFSGCFATGLRSLCTKAIGQGDTRRVNQLLWETIVFSALISLLMSALLWIFSSQVAFVLGARGSAENLMEPASVYLRALSPGILPVISVVVLSPLIQIDDGTRLVRISTLTLGVTDIGLDILAVKCGMGLWGVGLATSVSAWLSLFVLLIHFLKKGNLLRLIPCRILMPDIKAIVSLGEEAITRRIANVVRPILINSILISVGGSTALMVYAIRNNLLNFIRVVPNSISGASALLMNLFYGEANQEYIVEVGRCVHRINNRIGLCLALLGVLLSRTIAIAYLGSEDPSIPLLSFAIAFAFLQGYLSTLTLSRISYLQGIRKINYSKAMSLVLNLVYPVAFSFIFGIFFGAYGVMVGDFAANAFVLITVFIAYRLPKNQNIHGNRYIITDDFLNVSEGNVISLDIRNRKDVALLSHQVELFCNGHQIEHKIGYYSGLCAEEIALLLLDSNEKEHPMLHIRVVISDGNLILRFMDDSENFQLGKLSDRLNEGGKEDNLGMRIISAYASDIKYYKVLDINHTVISLRLE